MGREPVVDEAVTEERPDRRHRVLPADLLAFGHRAAVVADRHFVEPDVPLRQLGRQLRLDAEAIAVERRLLEDVAADRLVAGLHVRQVDVVEDVGQPGQEMVRDAVPVEQDFALRGGGEARAEDRVGLPFQDRRDQRRIVARVVFEVRVLDQADVAAHFLNRAADRGPLPHVLRLAEDADARLALGHRVRGCPPSRRGSRRRRTPAPSAGTPGWRAPAR